MADLTPDHLPYTPAATIPPTQSKNFLVLNLTNNNKNFIRLHNSDLTESSTVTNSGGGSATVTVYPGPRFITRIEPPANATTGYELTLLLDRQWDGITTLHTDGCIGLFVWPWNYQKIVPAHPGYDWQTSPMNIIFPKFVPYTSMQVVDRSTPSFINYSPDLLHKYYANGSKSWDDSPTVKANIQYAPYFMDIISSTHTTIAGSGGSQDYYYNVGDVLFHGMPWVSFDPLSQMYKWKNIQATNEGDEGTGYLQKLQMIAAAPKMIKLRYIENYMPSQHNNNAVGTYVNNKRNYWIVENISLLEAPDQDLGSGMCSSQRP
jgi:hypothetical protein